MQRRWCNKRRRNAAVRACRSYLAAVMPDFEYRQTVVSMKVSVPQLGLGVAADFRAVGRIPLVQGWKAVFGTADTDPGREKEEETETEQMLPHLVDGEATTLTDPGHVRTKLMACQTSKV